MTPAEQAAYDKLEATNVALRTHLTKAIEILENPAVKLALALTGQTPSAVEKTADPVDQSDLLRRATHAAPRAVEAEVVLPVVSPDEGDTSAAREQAMKIVLPSLFGKGARDRVRSARARD